MRGSGVSVRLGEVTEILTGFPFKSNDYSDDPSDPKLLRGDNIAQGRVRWDGVKRWPQARTAEVANYWLKEGDVILAMDRPWIEAGLKFCAIQADDLPCLLVQRVARLRGSNGLDNGFLRYLIGSQAFTDHVLAVQTGTAVPHISSKQIQGFRFELPPLSQQCAIAATLGALDDKIELNRKMNATLEAMARALFRDWFVDFGPTRAKMEARAPYLSPDLWSLFPDRLDEEGKPEGWEEKPLDEIADFLNGLALQKFPGEGQANSLPVIKIAELRNGITANSNRASRKVPLQYVIKDGDFLFSWSGSLLAKFWTGGEGALNQHLFKVTSDRYPAWFFSEWVQHHLEEFQIIAASKATTMGHIQRGHLKAAMTICPPDNIIPRLGEVVAPLIDRIVRNELESRTLAQTRDLLLPRLMSEELRVADLASFDQEAVA